MADQKTIRQPTQTDRPAGHPPPPGSIPVPGMPGHRVAVIQPPGYQWPRRWRQATGSKRTAGYWALLCDGTRTSDKAPCHQPAKKGGIYCRFHDPVNKRKKGFSPRKLESNRRREAIFNAPDEPKQLPEFIYLAKYYATQRYLYLICELWLDCLATGDWSGFESKLSDIFAAGKKAIKENMRQAERRKVSRRAYGIPDPENDRVFTSARRRDWLVENRQGSGGKFAIARRRAAAGVGSGWAPDPDPSGPFDGHMPGRAVPFDAIAAAIMAGGGLPGGGGVRPRRCCGRSIPD